MINNTTNELQLKTKKISQLNVFQDSIEELSEFLYLLVSYNQPNSLPNNYRISLQNLLRLLIQKSQMTGADILTSLTRYISLNSNDQTVKSFINLLNIESAWTKAQKYGATGGATTEKEWYRLIVSNTSRQFIELYFDNENISYTGRTDSLTNIQEVICNVDNLSFSYDSTNKNVAIIENDRIHILNSGDTTIVCTFVGDSVYSAARAEYTLHVIINNEKTNVNISFPDTLVNLVNVSINDRLPIQYANCTDNNGNTLPLPLVYTSDNITIAEIDEDKNLIIKSGGVVHITASFSGNDLYNTASASYTINITVDLKSDVTLSFTSGRVAYIDMKPGWKRDLQEVHVEGAILEQNRFTWESSDRTVAEIISENGIYKLRLVGTGQTYIKANFAGDSKYNPAEASYLVEVEINNNIAEDFRIFTYIRETDAYVTRLNGNVTGLRKNKTELRGLKWSQVVLQSDGNYDSAPIDNTNIIDSSYTGRGFCLKDWGSNHDQASWSWPEEMDTDDPVWIIIPAIFYDNNRMQFKDGRNHNYIMMSSLGAEVSCTGYVDLHNYGNEDYVMLCYNSNGGPENVPVYFKQVS